MDGGSRKDVHAPVDAKPADARSRTDARADGGDAQSAPVHVLTWDRYGELDIGACIPGTDAGYPCIAPATAALWVDWAETSPQNAWDVHDAGIHMYLYTDPSWITYESPWTDVEPEDMAHVCDASCDLGTDGGSAGCISRGSYDDYMTDPHSPHMLTVWRAAIAQYEGYARPSPAPPYDAVMEDDAVNTYGAKELPCGYVESNWVAADALLIANEEKAEGGLPVLFNGPFPGEDASVLGANTGLADASFGARMEECYVQNAPSGDAGAPSCADYSPLAVDSVWQSFENNEIFYASRHQFLICLENDVRPGTSQVTERMYQFASYLLTYDLGSTVLGTTFDTPTHFRVYPEVQLVAMDPLVAVDTSPSKPANWVLQLEDSGGAFFREYADCFYAGAPLGACAVVVNSSPCQTAPMPAFKGSFHHTLAIDPAHTEDVLAGGQATLTGPPPGPTVPPLTGLVLTL